MKEFRSGICGGMIVMLVVVSAGVCVASDAGTARGSVSGGEQWAAVGRLAAVTALEMMKHKADATASERDLIVMTNAGYAEVNGAPTQGALDGLTAVTGVSRGRNTLVEIHSAFWTPLWFAVYDKGSGCCAYLEVDPAKAARMVKDPLTAAPALFGRRSLERIDAAYLYGHAEGYKAKFDSKIFGGNEFRIVTIANAVAAGAPPDVIRAFEFHDHYCPGVISGILMARYVKARFPAGTSGYFVQALEPWCKEDALMVLLNATPGKRGFAISYPTKDDKAQRSAALKDAATIIYRRNEGTGRWEGLVLAFTWAAPPCAPTGNELIDKLCADLWYLARMDKPEDFVKAVKTFELAEGISPLDWARPGVDPSKMLEKDQP